MKKLTVTAVLCLFSILIFGQSKKLDQIWKAIEQNDFKSAMSLLDEDFKKNKADNDLLSTYLLISDIDSEPFTHGDKFVQLCKNNPAYNEAIYSLYDQNSACANENFTRQFTLVANNTLIQNKSVNFVNRTIAIDHKANYFQNKMMADSMEASIAALPGIRKWSLVGPFEDDFNSSYNKPNDAFKYIDSKHEFVNEDGVKLNWYEPGKFDNYPWITKMKYFDENENVVFAQSYIDVQKDGVYKIGIGYAGNLKVWIDDQLMHIEKETRVTDVANFIYNVNLLAGTHRILVQFGSYTANVPSFIVSMFDENTQAVNINSKAFATDYLKSPLKIERIKHFAEKHFEEKVKENPSSIFYSLLLAKAYLRNHKIKESLKVLHSIEEKYPNCGLINFYLLSAYTSDNNDTKATKYENEFKKIYPNLYQTLSSRYAEELRNSNKEKAIAILDTIIE